MTPAKDQRKFERIPIQNKVRILRNGRVIAYALAINLSLGGILLSAQPSLPAGSDCEVQILPGGASGAPVSILGTVVRSTEEGAAVQFASALATTSLESLVEPAVATSGLIDSFRRYYQVSRSKDLSQCETLLGVTKDQFRKVFYTTFSTSIPLSILPVWLMRASIPPYPNLVKILLAFAYAGVWLLVLQPLMDLAAFRFLRAKAARAQGRSGA